MPILIAAVVMASLLVWQGMFMEARQFATQNPAQFITWTLLILSVAVCCWWGNRMSTRKPALVIFAIVAIAGVVSYDPADGRGALGINIAPQVYRTTGLTFGSFTHRLAESASREIERAEFCASAIEGSIPSSPRTEGCRASFANGVDLDALAKLKIAAEAQDWQKVDIHRRNIGDDRMLYADLWD